MPVAFVGFDSAWTDNPALPGAICSIGYDGQSFGGFEEPTLVRFDQALDFVRQINAPGQLTLVAIDQPTIVPNQSGMRAAGRVAASAISWLGGGVQPANRSRIGMFDDGVSLQLWMSTTVANLGWTLGPTVLTAFAEDYDSWGDMSHLLPMETWSGPNAPRSIGYFVGCLPVPQQPPPTPSSMLQAAIQLADQWIAQSLPTLWPNYVPGKVASRYDVANFDGSDLYVQTPGGKNVSSRFSSTATAGFSNLYVVGDWTRTRFSGGCFESAIESAMLASRAISGIPAQIKTT